MGVLWCNERWIEEPGTLPVAATDRGMSLGLGLFETVLAVEGRPVFLERHLERLEAGCERLGWEPALEGMAEAMRELLERNGLSRGRARIRLALTAGSGPVDGLAAGEDRLRWMSAAPAMEAAERVEVTVSPWRRNERSPLAGLKCACYAENVAALDHARRLGFREALFFNTADELCEAATANVFVVREGRVATPRVESGCLPGVTRRVVMELARRRGLACEESVLGRADLEEADELFLTSAIRGPVPVSRCGERTLGEPRIGSAIRAWWLEAVRGD